MYHDSVLHLCLTQQNVYIVPQLVEKLLVMKLTVSCFDLSCGIKKVLSGPLPSKMTDN